MYKIKTLIQSKLQENLGCKVHLTAYVFKGTEYVSEGGIGYVACYDVNYWFYDYKRGEMGTYLRRRYISDSVYIPLSF